MIILQLVTKNTSTLDYSLPILWELCKKNPEYKVFVLYCVADKRKILRESRFYSDELEKIGATEFDFMSLLPKKTQWAEQFFRYFFKVSESDQKGFTDFKGTPNRWVIKKLSILFELSLAKLQIIIEKVFLVLFLHVNRIIDHINPDIVILDNRISVSFIGDRKLFNNIFERNIPKIVVPHAPHYINRYESFVHVNPFGAEIYSECDIWLPFLPSTPWEKRPELKEQFIYAGYPGFDKRWLEYCKQLNKYTTQRPLSCLYIGRKFLDKGVRRPKGLDFVTLDYDDVLEELINVKNSLLELGCEIEFIVKPHPSSNYLLLKKILKESGIPNWNISNEPFYALLGGVDIVISPYSTSLLLLAISGVPTILLRSELQDTINEHWDEVEKLYTGLKYYIEPDKLQTTLVTLKGKDFSSSVSDIKHLRKYFPDGALNLTEKRIIKLVDSDHV